jgi:hypothetical protein
VSLREHIGVHKVTPRRGVCHVLVWDTVRGGRAESERVTGNTTHINECSKRRSARELSGAITSSRERRDDLLGAARRAKGRLDGRRARVARGREAVDKKLLNLSDVLFLHYTI